MWFLSSTLKILTWDFRPLSLCFSQRTPDKKYNLKAAQKAHDEVGVAIPVALYRPQIGPPARNGKKWGGQNPHREKGKKMAEKWENWPENGRERKFSPKSV